MSAREKYNVVTLGSMVLLILGTAGCLATHKYVQNEAVQPLKGQIQTVDKKVDKVDSRATEIDQRVSDVDRRAEQGITGANDKAQAADQDAQKANQAAQGAQQTADKGVGLATKAEQDIDNIDNYQAVKTESVLFGFNRYDLTDDDQQQLGNLTQTITPLKHYAIEVVGFTDKVGPKDYNLELSRKRADTVVRYLNENAHVPLVKIHVVGLGDDEPVADNKTRDGRKQNRRVEVRVMAPGTGQGPEAAVGTQTH
jgi:outer membrane protein OmpA-like peptidoglycan-associated protein